MKIQLDTTNKTVKIEENIKVLKLIATLKKLLPEDWKEFTLETNTTIIDWSEPYIIKHYPIYPKPYYPWYGGTWMRTNKDKVLCSVKSNTADYSLKSGIYNVEV